MPSQANPPSLSCSGQACLSPSFHSQFHVQSSGTGFSGQETPQVQLAHPGEHGLHKTSVLPLPRPESSALCAHTSMDS